MSDLKKWIGDFKDEFTMDGCVTVFAVSATARQPNSCETICCIPS